MRGQRGWVRWVVGLTMTLAFCIQVVPVYATSQAEVADLLVRITGLRSRLPWPAVVGDKVRLLSGYGYVPVGGWSPRDEMPGWQIALLVVRVSQGKQDLPSPFKNDLAVGKLAVVEGLDTEEWKVLTDGDSKTGLNLSPSGWVYIDLGTEVSIDMVSNLLGTAPGTESIHVLHAGGNPLEFPGDWIEIEPPKELQGIVNVGSLFEPVRCRFVRWSWSLQEGTAQDALFVEELQVCNYVDQLTEELYLANVVTPEAVDNAVTATQSLNEFYQTVPFVPEIEPPPIRPRPRPPHPPFEPPGDHPGEIPGTPGERPDIPGR